MLPGSLDNNLEALEQLDKKELVLLRWVLNWRRVARDKQLPPDDIRPNWTMWGALTGRGWGKTRVFANWLGQEAAINANTINAVIAPTQADVETVCFEGPTGLLSVIPDELITDYRRSHPITLTLWNKSIIRGYAGDSPERMRGPQHHNAWADEVASFQYPEAAISNLELGLRLGPRPKLGWSSTPKPRAFLKELIRNTIKHGHLTTGSLYENRENLPSSFLESLLKYEGTRLGQQELYGEILDPEELGIVKRSQWRLWPADKPLPKFHFVLMSLDTATTEKTVDNKTHDPDYTACSVWGLFDHNGKTCMMLVDAWQDHLALNDLITRVKTERMYAYGDQQAPAFRQAAFSPLIHTGNYGRRVDAILIEQQGAGRPLVQMLAAESIFAYEYNPGKADKLQRLHMVSPLFAHRRVWAVESEKRQGHAKNWAEETITQVCSYAGKGSLPHDDALDSATQALRYLMENFSGPLTVEARPNTVKVEVEIDRPFENPYAA